MMRLLSEGRTDVDLPVDDRRDEIGDMQRAFRVFAIMPKRSRARRAEAEADEQREREREARAQAEREAEREQAEAEKRKALAQLADAFESSVSSVASNVANAREGHRGTAPAARLRRPARTRC